MSRIHEALKKAEQERCTAPSVETVAAYKNMSDFSARPGGPNHRPWQLKRCCPCQKPQAS